MVNLKVLWVMTPVPLQPVNIATGKEQTAHVAFIPGRLVVLYSTHRPMFSWEQIGGVR